MKLSPSNEEMRMAGAMLTPIIVQTINGLTLGKKVTLSDEQIASVRQRLDEAIAAAVTDGRLPDRAWPPVQVEHDAEGHSVNVHFGGSNLADLTPEQRAELVCDRARSLWDGMEQALRIANPDAKKPPPCEMIGQGLGLYAAPLATYGDALEPEEAMMAAAWQVLTHTHGGADGGSHRMAH